ncbi:MAG: Cyclic di-GMP phosphodiesterase Gmr [Pelotomaculum sp. PtaU1.Bin035]|nr:MAG: Cyclic di-GMP phosphodiesterase Gmr [Pelotomaculum sp. PtaU1.Bin035]
MKCWYVSMNKLLSLIPDQLDVGIIVLDNDYMIKVWNGWLERLTGKNAGQVIGTRLADVCPRLNKKIYFRIFYEAVSYGKNRFCSGALHRFFISPANESRCAAIRQNMLVQPVQIGDERFILIQIFDITGQHQRVQHLKSFIDELTINHQKLKASEETIRYQAYHDSMTGLPNRLLLMDRLNIAIAHAHRNKHCLAVLFLDLDHFKYINDTLGHAAGDLLLQEAAVRLTSCVRKSDTVARLGGDEFVLLVPEITELNSVSIIAMKIINTIIEPWVYQDKEHFVTASVGVALFPYDGEEAGELIKNADSAMFRAKELGKNNYQFFNEEIYANNAGKLDNRSLP